MQFLKQDKKYIQKELAGGISNTFRFAIKDLYKTEKVQSVPLCQKCEALLVSPKCMFCGLASELQIKEHNVKNFSYSEVSEKEKITTECMILMIDISGSMNCSYPSKYKKINKEFVIRVIGQANFDFLKNALGEAEVIKNFKGIELLIDNGQTIKDIALTFKQQLSREKKNQSNLPKQIELEQYEYISRKQIVQIGVAKYIESLRSQRPNTLVTVVYFNSKIEIPSQNFKDFKIINNLDDKTIEEMVELGQTYAQSISISSVKDIGDKLISNMTKVEPDGQTAMTPCLAFCFGLTKKFKYDLHQIIIVTDGLSNVGFGQTQDKVFLDQSKKIYEFLAHQYAIKNNCIVNVIGFEDCAIGYDVIDQVIKGTGGLPYNISFIEENKEKVVNNDTINHLNMEMITGFCESTKQFCYDTRLAVKVHHPKIKLKIPKELQYFVKLDEGNMLSFDIGIKSVNQNFSFQFQMEEMELPKNLDLKVSVVNQYRRNKRRNYAVRDQLIQIVNGSEEEAVKSQVQVVQKQVQNKLKVKIDEDNLQDYISLQKKIENEKIAANIDASVLQKFKKRKNEIENYQKNTDKLSRDMKSMKSRRQKTYKQRQANQEEYDDVFG